MTRIGEDCSRGCYQANSTSFGITELCVLSNTISKAKHNDRVQESSLLVRVEGHGTLYSQGEKIEVELRIIS